MLQFSPVAGARRCISVSSKHAVKSFLLSICGWEQGELGREGKKCWGCLLVRVGHKGDSWRDSNPTSQWMPTPEVCVWAMWWEWHLACDTCVPVQHTLSSLPSHTEQSLRLGCCTSAWIVRKWCGPLQDKGTSLGSKFALAFSLWDLVADSHASSREEREAMWTPAGVRAYTEVSPAAPGSSDCSGQILDLPMQKYPFICMHTSLLSPHSS